MDTEFEKEQEIRFKMKADMHYKIFNKGAEWIPTWLTHWREMALLCTRNLSVVSLKISQF